MTGICLQKNDLSLINKAVQKKLSLEGPYWSSTTSSESSDDVKILKFSSWSTFDSKPKTDAYGIIAVRTFTASLPLDAGKKSADGTLSFTISSKNIKLNGTANKLLKVVDGNYTLKIRPDNQIVMNLKLEVIKTFNASDFPDISSNKGKWGIENPFQIYICDEDGFRISDLYILKSNFEQVSLFDIANNPAGSVHDIKLTKRSDSDLTDDVLETIKKQNISYIEWNDFDIGKSEYFY